MDDIFDDLLAQCWEDSKTPLDRLYDAILPGWEQAEMPIEFPVNKLVDQAGLPVVCSACGHSDLWAMTEYGKWRCAGNHEPVCIGRGWIEQVIEVNPDEVMIGRH